MCDCTVASSALLVSPGTGLPELVPLPPPLEEEGTDLRAAGTLRLMFSRASRLSAWKSGCRNVQLCSPNWASSDVFT
jgi:hypothetical protein